MKEEKKVSDYKGFGRTEKDNEKDNGGIHSCSYACMRPGCIEYQRNELFRKLEAERAVIDKLTATLKEMIELWEDDPAYGWDTVEKARRAIAEAEGA